MLTQSQLQSLKSYLKVQITDAEEYLSYLKDDSKSLYSKADPADTENGKFYFETLNLIRDEHRKQKQALKTLVGIQKAVKVQLAQGS